MILVESVDRQQVPIFVSDAEFAVIVARLFDHQGPFVVC